MINNISPIIFSFLLLSSQLLTYGAEIKFDQLTITHGLSNNTIHCIMQDSRGFLWFGTEDGLNKYDGYTFTIYRHKLNQRNSISDNFINAVLEDSRGAIWIGTDNGGLTLFDWKTENFTHFYFDPNNDSSLSENSISTIYEDRAGTIWIGTLNEGLNQYNPASNSFIRYQHDSDNLQSLSNNRVRAILEDKKGYLWIGTQGGGLNKFDKNKKVFKRFYSYPKQPNSLSSIDINALMEDKQGIIWIATAFGLTSLLPDEEQFVRYFHQHDDESSLSNNIITCLLQDCRGDIWIGTEAGINKFNKRDKTFLRIKPNLTNIHNMNPSIIRSIFEDSGRTLWIGTVNEGIGKLTLGKRKFQHIRHDPNNNKSLSCNTVRSIYIDRRDLLWIGTLGGGLNLFDKQTRYIRTYNYEKDNPYSLAGNVVSALIQDRYGYLWVGTWGNGITRFLTPEKQGDDIKDVVHYKKDRKAPTSISDNIIQDFYEDSYGNLWIGTGGGLDLYDRQNERFIHFRHDPNDPLSLIDNRIQSNSIVEDEEGNLWIGTWAGLSKLLRSSDFWNGKAVFLRYSKNPDNSNSLSDNRITSLLFNKGILWIGTGGGGLNRMIRHSAEKDSFSSNYYTEDEGLPNNFIYSIVADENGDLWLSTNSGLSKFNPQTETFKNFYQSDGLQSNQFYWGAGCKGNDGQLYFGGINGFNAFYPSKITDNQHVPPVVITDFQISNKSVYKILEYKYLLKTMAGEKVVELPYNHDIFSFEFAALDYVNPLKNQYAYMLEGVEDDWVYAGRRRFATYSNLKEGEYVFRVKGSNNDEVWNNTGTSLKLIIQPPFWRTWWFFLIVFVIIAGNITYIVTLRIRRFLTVERLRNQLAADLHDNIGAGLTEISILSEVISKKLDTVDSDIRNDLRLIGKNSRSLIDNMSDIVWLVNPKRDSLYDLISRLGDRYSELLFQTDISFTAENLKSLQNISLPIQHRQQLFLIFKEAINNSLKHSNCSEIVLKTEINGKNLRMLLQDNGRGFKTETVTKGIGLQNMVKRSNQIKGVLKIDSAPGQGTCIAFNGKL